MTPFFSDTFKNTTSAVKNLTGTAPDTGAGVFATTAGTGFAITAAGGWLRNSGTAQNSQYINATNGTGNADTVAYDLKLASVITGEFLGIIIGNPTTSIYTSGYKLQYTIATSSFDFKDMTTGGAPTGGSGTSSIGVTLGVGTTYHIEFTVSTTTVSFSINGVHQMTYTPGAGVNTPAAGVGFDGIAGTAPTDATGLQISNVVVYSTAVQQNVIAPDDGNVLLSPGNQYINPGTSLEWIFPGTSAKIATAGTSLGVYVSVANLVAGGIGTTYYPSLEYSIDNGPWILSSPTSTGLVPFTTGAAVYGHYAEVRMVPSATDNESSTYGSPGVAPYSSFLITGFWTDYGITGGTIALSGASAGPPNTAIMDGDSIAHGYDVLSNMGTGATTALFSIPTMIGHGLNATMGNKSHSGQGVISPASNNVAPNLQTTISKADASHNRVIPSTLKYWLAAEGTNDSTLRGNSTAAAISAGIVTVLTSMRSQATAAGATNCILVWVSPPATVVTQDSVPMAVATAAGVAAYKLANPADQRVLHVDLTPLNLNIINGHTGQYNNATADVHPGTEASMMIAAYVVGQVKAFEASLSGGAATTVTHNTSGANNLQATVDGVPSAGVRIVAYLQSDYAAGNQVIQAWTISDPTGGFSSESPSSYAKAMMLPAGSTYTLAYYLGAQLIGTKTLSI